MTAVRLAKCAEFSGKNQMTVGFPRLFIAEIASSPRAEDLVFPLEINTLYVIILICLVIQAIN